MPNRSLPVLVVDDFGTMCRIMKGIVQQVGFSDVDICRSGEAALELLKTRKYAFILCDHEMEPMTGAEFASRARRPPYSVQCPIILTTASHESMALCVRTGIHELVDGFLAKPFKAADLQARLSFVEERERRREALAGHSPPAEERQDTAPAAI